MVHLIVDGLVNLLSGAPNPLLPAASIGPARPSTAAELPAIAVAVTIDDIGGTGLARFIRSGNVLQQHVAQVSVAIDPATFVDDLRHLRLAPLPMKQNPASLTEDFGDLDVTVVNVTALPHLPYRMTDRPAHREEFSLDAASAELTFGAAQAPGDRLEVTHWTVGWRDDIVGYRYAGLLGLEIWAGSAAQTDDLSRKVESRVAADGATLRRAGFGKLHPASLKPTENLFQQPPSGSPFAAWKQGLGFRFSFESEQGGDPTSDGVIKRIKVDTRPPRESWAVG
jgi:hypothetical protein